MPLIAFRTEYQLTVDPEKNRIFYKMYEASRLVDSLPHYLADWQQALAVVEPGFTILTDVTQFSVTNPALFELFVEAQQLLVAAGVQAVAEVHQPDAPTLQVSAEAQHISRLPVHRFTDLWAADQFLDSQRQEA